MRYYDNGSGFTVSFTSADAEDLADFWPCSTVKGKGHFAFADNGDLVDMSPVSDSDGPDWVAFSQDCHKWGLRKRTEAKAKKINVGSETDVFQDMVLKNPHAHLTTTPDRSIYVNAGLKVDDLELPILVTVKRNNLGRPGFDIIVTTSRNGIRVEKTIKGVKFR